MVEPNKKKYKINTELTQGRPQYRPDSRTYTTDKGITIERTVTDLTSSCEANLVELVSNLDSKRGCIFESAYEYPGRYARWTMGFCNPPISLESWGYKFKLSALNERGEVLLGAFFKSFELCEAVDNIELIDNKVINGKVKERDSSVRFNEEDRSKQNSIFSIIRNIIELWSSDEDPQLGLYGSFGYDLTFQFESIKLKHKRDENQRDLLLYLPDEILVFDKQANQAWKIEYDFTTNNKSTKGLARTGFIDPFVGNKNPLKRRDHEPGEFAKSVETAKEEFRVGNLFEAVLSQTFYEPFSSKPSDILNQLRKKNPSPYMFVINLGEQEWLVGASPEMFVRVEGTEQGLRVETCPISGTIKRGENALEDADRIREILVNRKEESELTMCTDVDRNDKSRICRQGSVEVIGRRQIEKYSKLIHTVDHVEGYLRNGFDALDAFLCHTWAVTVTGAPKVWATQFVENHEKSARCWYGGAVGLIGFDGHLNTGMTLRTIRLLNGVAEIRAGATLLYDSNPDDEEKETELKASAFRGAVLDINSNKSLNSNGKKINDIDKSSIILFAGSKKRVVLIDHQDSFVHTLANYVRQTGADVTTVRCGISKDNLTKLKPDLVIMSPGPGNPSSFNCSKTLDMLIELKLPVFGVCLGLQSMVEHFGATLDVLPYPMHGKPSQVKKLKENDSWNIFDGISDEFTVARYHSLYGTRSSIDSNDNLVVTAELVDGTVMGLAHKTLPMAAVQFHPESILTRPMDGLKILSNALLNLHY